jgi:hypothetical protein
LNLFPKRLSPNVTFGQVSWRKRYKVGVVWAMSSSLAAGVGLGASWGLRSFSVLGLSVALLGTSAMLYYIAKTLQSTGLAGRALSDALKAHAKGESEAHPSAWIPPNRPDGPHDGTQPSTPPDTPESQ